MTNDVTHIVTKSTSDLISGRTEKFLYGVSRGLWIVSFECMSCIHYSTRQHRRLIRQWQMNVACGMCGMCGMCVTLYMCVCVCVYRDQMLP
jgi:TPP-dependent indolepyruvate ferredoxin oxidoreductase alpha subunit